MSPTHAVRSRRLARVGLALVAAVVVGLLGMHTLDAGASASVGPGQEHAAAAQPGAHHGADAQADPAEAVAGCATCEASGHLAMTAACMLLLLAVGLALTAPGLRPAWLHEPAPTVGGRPRLSSMPSRAPSLYALCISRT